MALVIDKKSKRPVEETSLFPVGMIVDTLVKLVKTIELLKTVFAIHCTVSDG